MARNDAEPHLNLSPIPAQEFKNKRPIAQNAIHEWIAFRVYFSSFVPFWVRGSFCIWYYSGEVDMGKIGRRIVALNFQKTDPSP